MKYRLVLFDVDSTLIQQEVIDLLAARTDQGALVADITSRAMAGELDFSEALKARVSLLKGLPESVIDDVQADISFSPGARELVAELRDREIRVGAVSGGFINVLAPFFSDLHLDFLRANELEISANHLSGSLIGPIINRQAKRDALEEFASSFSVDLAQTVAVGDGANDLSMIEIAGLGVSYRGKPILNTAADIVLTDERLDALLNYL